jgi:transposase-like protein
MAIRLSNEVWQEIEVSYRAGSTAKQLARRHGVSASAIFHRSSSERWRDTPRAVATPSPVERLERVADRLENLVCALLNKEEK